jgi:hypothetical protein
MKRSAEIFEMVVGLDVDARVAVLDRECGQDRTLRAEVESLLEAHEAAGAFLGTPTHSLGEAGRRSSAADDPATCDIAPAPASRVMGRYTLLEPIGEGGFGTVWMAEQREPVKRRVALKIIKRGMDSSQVIARFEAERQALAMMDHPNIAKVLDGGSTESGQPYFVMEYIRGVPILQLRYREARHACPTGALHPGLPGHPARPPEGDHPPRHQALQRDDHPSGQRAGRQGHRLRHCQGDQRRADHPDALRWGRSQT